MICNLQWLCFRPNQDQDVLARRCTQSAVLDARSLLPLLRPVLPVTKRPRLNTKVHTMGSWVSPEGDGGNSVGAGTWGLTASRRRRRQRKHWGDGDETQPSVSTLCPFWRLQLTGAHWEVVASKHLYRWAVSILPSDGQLPLRLAMAISFWIVYLDLMILPE